MRIKAIVWLGTARFAEMRDFVAGLTGAAPSVNEPGFGCSIS